MIYLDYAATTPVDPIVAEKMAGFLTQTGVFANPHSAHALGRAAKTAVEEARAHLADFIHVKPEAMIWTSGATEANNLALFGMAHSKKDKPIHFITSLIEHEAVLEPCRQLEKEGVRITYLKSQKNGQIRLEDLLEALTPETTLVSIMHVNNETGVIQPIEKIGEILKAKGILFHVDAAQSMGKLPIDLSKLPVDLMSFSAHKVYGPKGMGALFVNQSEISLQPLIVGGGQERGLRAGTLATHQIVGFGEALVQAQHKMAEECVRITALRARLWEGLKKIGNVYLNSNVNEGVPHILNVSFEGVRADRIIPALKNIAISTSSACHAHSASGSHVLRAMGVSETLIHSALRFSLGRFTTEAEIDEAVFDLGRIVNLLRA